MSATVAATRRRDNRVARFNSLEWCRDHVKRKGQGTCMMAVNGGVTVGATAAGDVHTKGVKRCASPWACPVCAPTIAERRAQEIDQACKRWIEDGGSIYMVTATHRHKFGDNLAGLLDMQQAAWSRTWRWEAAHYSTRAKTLGQITNADRVRPDWYGGQCRTVEITYGVNGWHPHIHALVFMPAGADRLGSLLWMRERWRESVEKFGGTTDVTLHRRNGRNSSWGWDVRPVTTSEDVSRYVTKVEGGWSAGKEIAKSDQKHHGQTPWALLQLAVAGDVQAAALFTIYERATRGLRRIVSSPGLVPMVEDVEAAEAILHAELTVMVQVRAEVWRKLLRSRQAAALLSDVGDLATGTLDRWCWPASWLLTPALAGG